MTIVDWGCYEQKGHICTLTRIAFQSKTCKRKAPICNVVFTLDGICCREASNYWAFFTACCTFLWCFGFLWKFCNYQTSFSNWRVTGAQMLSGLKNLACVAMSSHPLKPDWLLVHLSQFEVERIERLCKCYRSEPRLPLRLSGFQSDRLKSHLWVGDYQQMCSQATQLELPRSFHGPIALRYRRRWH